MNHKYSSLGAIIALLAGLHSGTAFCQEPNQPRNESETARSGDSDGYGKTHGMLGSVTVGPAVTLLSFPHPMQLGIEGKVNDMFGFAATYGFIPDINVANNAKINIKSYGIDLKWFPFRNAFFVGTAIGNQVIHGHKSQTIQGTTVNADIDVNSTYYTPMAGFRWVWPSGFFLGIDAGWQIAGGATTTLTTDVTTSNPLLALTPEFVNLQSDVTTAGNNIGNKAIPSFTLIHYGWLF